MCPKVWIYYRLPDRMYIASTANTMDYIFCSKRTKGKFGVRSKVVYPVIFHWILAACLDLKHKNKKFAAVAPVLDLLLLSLRSRVLLQFSHSKEWKRRRCYLSKNCRAAISVIDATVCPRIKIRIVSLSFLFLWSTCVISCNLRVYFYNIITLL